MRNYIKNQIPTTSNTWGKRSQGFGIIEALVGTVIIVAVAAGAISIFTISTRSSLLSRQENEVQSAIDADLANILDVNQRFACTNSSCSLLPADGINEDSYFPDPTNQTATSFFLGLCDANGRQQQNSPNQTLADGSDQSLVDRILPFINNIGRPSSFSGQNGLGITRESATAEVYGSSPTRSGHRYTVRWTRSINGTTQTVRQITLTPTAAHWCP